jgi:hypothetical protein
MSRYVSYLIEDVRESTENEEFSDTFGIKDKEFLRFLNDAQYRIHSLIIQKHPSVFMKESVTSITADQEVYTLPIDTYAGNRVVQVEFSTTGLDTDYYPLRPSSLYRRNKGAIGDPTHYIRKAGTVLLSPVPANSVGSLRITYSHKLPKLDLRRGSVATVVLTSSAITTLTLDVSTDSVDSTTLDKFTRMTIVDEEGNVQMKNIKFTNADSGTGVVTIDSAFTFESGETISVGDYVVAGAVSSTHTELDDMVERYLIAYATFKILHRDSNVDSDKQQQVLLAMESEIVESFAELTDDITEIPNIISYDDEWSGF